MCRLKEIALQDCSPKVKTNTGPLRVTDRHLRETAFATCSFHVYKIPDPLLLVGRALYYLSALTFKLAARYVTHY